jgi:hypothetical protein
MHQGIGASRASRVRVPPQISDTGTLFEWHINMEAIVTVQGKITTGKGALTKAKISKITMSSCG